MITAAAAINQTGNNTITMGDASDTIVLKSICQEDVLPLQRRNTYRETQALKDAVAEFERQHIKAVLAAVDGRRGEAAKMLGIHRNTLTAKISDLGIEV